MTHRDQNMEQIPGNLKKKLLTDLKITLNVCYCDGDTHLSAALSCVGAAEGCV